MVREEMYKEWTPDKRIFSEKHIQGEHLFLEYGIYESDDNNK